MNVLRRLTDALGGGSINDRLTALERLVKKLDDSERHSSASLDKRLADLARTVNEQPTAKDFRELRQALRGATDRQPATEWLFEAIDQIVAPGDRPILIGPWTGEVGFELLYWIPFVRWVRAHWNVIMEREVVVSRGGVTSWYGQASSAYFDIFSSFAAEEFRCAVAEEKRKHRKPGAFDNRIIDAVVQRRGPVEVLHPGLMYRLFAPYWSDEAGYALLDRFTRHQLMDPPAGMRPAHVGTGYVAVRFYFNECFPATPENRAFARDVVLGIAEQTPVVLLNPGISVDEHNDWAPDGAGTITRIDDRTNAESNLAVQSAIIAGARAFVGTYGGYSYLAPLYQVPAVAFYSKPSFKLHHLHAAERAFRQIGAAALTAINASHAPVVRLALGALLSR